MKYIKLNSGHKFNQLTVIKLDNYKKFPMKNGYFRKKNIIYANVIVEIRLLSKK